MSDHLNKHNRLVLIAALTILLIIAGIGVKVALTGIRSLTLNDVCPDYFKEHYGFVVDENGNGNREAIANGRYGYSMRNAGKTV